MTKLALLCAAALLSAAVAAPAAAQEVVYNPGHCAQFYPNANCQNKGSNSPYTGDHQLTNRIRGAYARGPVPVRWAPSTTLTAAVAVMPATVKGQAAGVRGATRPAAIPWRFRFP
jgi:hypothetical protein